MPDNFTPSPSGPDIDDVQAPNYVGYSLRSHYDRDEGNLVIPLMGPDGTPPLVVKVHASFGSRVVEWSAAKGQVPPMVPANDMDTPSGDKILSSTVITSMPSPTQGLDAYQFVVSGRNVYLQNPTGAPRGSTDDYESGHEPYNWPLIDTASLVAGANGPNGASPVGSAINLADPNNVWLSTDFPADGLMVDTIIN